MSSTDRTDTPLTLAGRAFRSRLMVGTGKYQDLEETRAATEASGAEIVTVAIRRTNIGQRPGEPNLLDVISPGRYTLLPNTAGCYTADDAVRTCRLARELLDGHELVKLEVLGDEKTLFPDILETIKATEILVSEGFQVMVYTNDDPIIAKRFEDMGCVAVMPLAAPRRAECSICFAKLITPSSSPRRSTSVPSGAALPSICSRVCTPSSVAFCTTVSMRGPRLTPCRRVTASGDSRSTGRPVPTSADTPPRATTLSTAS